MAALIERFQPSFVHWPLQNNRTAYQPVNIPLVLVVPFMREPSTGAGLVGSQVTNLKFFIEEAPGLVPVAGFEHHGVFVPQFERFVLNVTNTQLNAVQINIPGQQFFDQVTGEPKPTQDAVEGDFFEYTLNRGLVAASGPRDRIKWYPDANYYDLSTFVIETIDLKPLGNYKFSWQCNFNNRISTPNGELFCIDDKNDGVARFSMTMKHPGEIHQTMIEQTPVEYFDGTPLDQDNLVKFYRPFADALQDLFDEQELMVGVNFIDQIPAQFIPYLSYLIGWDLPFFPGSTDKIRRAVLKNGRRLQQLKGSRRVIRELFELFGFTIDIVNLWYRRDGSAFVGPGELQPAKYKDEEIEVSTVCQTEVLMADYSTDGFGEFDIPLLWRPNGNITLDAWLVDTSTGTYTQLKNLLNTIDVDPEGLMASVCPTTSSGFALSAPLQTAVAGTGVGYSQILVQPNFGGIDEHKVGQAPLNKVGIEFDPEKNIVHLKFDRYIKFGSNLKLFVFATYQRQKLTIPTKLTDMRSNRFDIVILFNRITGETPNSQLLDFLLDFIFKLKAFHSILRKIVYTTQVIDVYNVIDFCMGGKVAQAPGSDLGELQTIPPIIPISPGSAAQDCVPGSFTRGFKESDFALRDEILRGLKEEHNTWRRLDGTHLIPDDLAPILESLSRITPNIPDKTLYGGTGSIYGTAVYGKDQPCEWTQFGQDRVVDLEEPSGIQNSVKDFDFNPDTRPKLCDDTGNVLDNCFKGRVGQDIILGRDIVITDIASFKPCPLSLGEGFYYQIPPFPHTIKTLKYGDDVYGDVMYGSQEIDVTNVNNIGKSLLTDLLIKVAAFPDPVNFTGTLGLEDQDITNNLAIRRPSLNIKKDNLFFPGHRFVFMSALENDFVHPTYTFRPWDTIFGLCPEQVPPGYPTLEQLDPQVVLSTNGLYVLTFNQIPYKIVANGLDQDISSLGSHDSRDFLVTHAIFSTARTAPAIDSRTEGSTDFTSLETVCFGSDYGPIFASANRDCPCENPSSSFLAGTIGPTNPGEDFIDGYPAEYGQYAVNVATFGYDRDFDLNLLLGLPFGDGTGSYPVPSTLLFRMGSGIRVTSQPQSSFYAPYRLDCGCQIFECQHGTGTGGTTSGSTAGAGPAAVDLLTAGDFAAFAYSGISNATAPAAITGDMGISPATAAAITGFALVLDGSGQFSTSTQVVGKVYASDYTAPTPAKVLQAQNDVLTAYNDAIGRAVDFLNFNSGTLDGQTLVPGVYKWTTGVTLGAGQTVTISGGPNDRIILISTGVVSTGAASNIVLTGGIQAANVFWAPISMAIGASAIANGIILSSTTISLGSLAILNGRALAQTAITMDQSTITEPADIPVNPTEPPVPPTPSTIHIDSCELANFIDDNGDFDPNLDRVETDRSMVLIDSYGAKGAQLGKYPFTQAKGDLEIANLLTFDPQKLQLTTTGSFPPSGSFFYVDPYGVINDGNFEVFGSRMDITVTTKDPRVWGETSQGFIRDGRVWRKGIVTTCRQILDVSDPNHTIIIGSGCQQRVDFFQTTFLCKDKRPSDPFLYHVDMGIVDSVEIDVICGPGWSGSVFDVWPDLIVDSAGNVHLSTPHGDQPFEWVNSWFNIETLNTLCPQGTGSLGTGG